MNMGKYIDYEKLEKENQEYRDLENKLIEEITIIIRDCEENDLEPTLNDLDYILGILIKEKERKRNNWNN